MPTTRLMPSIAEKEGKRALGCSRLLTSSRLPKKDKESEKIKIKNKCPSDYTPATPRLSEWRRSVAACGIPGRDVTGSRLTKEARVCWWSVRFEGGFVLILFCHFHSIRTLVRSILRRPLCHPLLFPATTTVRKTSEAAVTAGAPSRGCGDCERRKVAGRLCVVDRGLSEGME
ncbi:hypothetical protein HNY73_006787 [Argiope bruennichi]|uniref:Uncharacterized protein n=1 Tax=Argiope bruennichi TaxID=94029 RepID=A0A8T0FCZ0_ARGBR|nr:hypothetical protein HNY73_006787 [Argiope bruennichi]